MLTPSWSRHLGTELHKPLVCLLEQRRKFKKIKILSLPLTLNTPFKKINKNLVTTVQFLWAIESPSFKVSSPDVAHGSFIYHFGGLAPIFSSHWPPSPTSLPSYSPRAPPRCPARHPEVTAAESASPSGEHGARSCRHVLEEPDPGRDTLSRSTQGRRGGVCEPPATKTLCHLFQGSCARFQEPERHP